MCSKDVGQSTEVEFSFPKLERTEGGSCLGGEGRLEYVKFKVLFLANHHSNASEVQTVGGMIL